MNCGRAAPVQLLLCGLERTCPGNLRFVAYPCTLIDFQLQLSLLILQCSPKTGPYH